jgi:hypothetical protein
VGKWSKLKGKLAALPDPENDFFAAVRLRADQLRETTTGLESLSDLVLDNEKKIGDLDGQIKVLRVENEACERVLMERMEDLGLEQAAIKGYTWSPFPEPYPQVKDKVALRKWAETNGMIDVLAIPHQTLKATVKNCIEEGSSWPDGVDVFLKQTFRRTKKRDSGD